MKGSYLIRVHESYYTLTFFVYFDYFPQVLLENGNLFSLNRFWTDRRAGFGRSLPSRCLGLRQPRQPPRRPLRRGPCTPRRRSCRCRSHSSRSSRRRCARGGAGASWVTGTTTAGGCCSLPQAGGRSWGTRIPRPGRGGSAAATSLSAGSR